MYSCLLSFILSAVIPGQSAGVFFSFYYVLCSSSVMLCYNYVPSPWSYDLGRFPKMVENWRWFTVVLHSCIWKCIINVLKHNRLNSKAPIPPFFYIVFWSLCVDKGLVSYNINHRRDVAFLHLSWTHVASQLKLV